ncbi:protein TILLER ANGLE CONTROL 1-like [Hibiscus syriacus]|uniref:protein TILLER ANGLE CONTROL 1-like n=1 Tax=Hibiscus syriacus TaxID=106335 RepID=UPI001924FD33|nr:protein TILLER ANGLE CONTROL 1-like [Hibiscus syriacus]
MKIFNWVQKRFHHNVLKDGLARNVKKTDSLAIDSNTKALLEHVALSDMLDGWRDGILTIGTLGFDPLKQNDYLALESYIDDDDKEDKAEEELYTDNNDEEDENVENESDEEVNPLVLSALEHSLEEVDGESDVMMMMFDGDGGSTDHEIKIDLEATEGHSGKLRRRTTLADLFSEDSDIKNKHCPLELNSGSTKKPSARTKNGLSFAKKLIPQVGEDSRPIKMLHHMMRRMLKRKIHPELEGKGQCKSTVIDALAKKTFQSTESVSLLQSPDAAIA